MRTTTTVEVEEEFVRDDRLVKKNLKLLSLSRPCIKTTSSTCTGSDEGSSSHPSEYPSSRCSPSEISAENGNDDKPSSSVDRYLKGYTKFMAPGVHQDRTLKLIQYSLWMVAHCIFSISSQHALGNALLQHYSEISYARYILRWLGLPSAIEGARRRSLGYSASSEYSQWHKVLGTILAWAMVGYYPLEHGAYLHWKTPISDHHRFAEKLSAWSCCFWLAYILAELCQCFLKLGEDLELKRRVERKKKTDDEDGSIRQARLQPSALWNLRLTIVRNGLILLPALHWSLPNWDTDPWLSHTAVYPLLWLEAVICMYQTIVNFWET